MALPFFKIKPDVQDEHCLMRNDILRLKEFKQSLDPRIIDHCALLREHKRKCPICSWPRLYPAIRKLKRAIRIIRYRKII